MAHPTVRCLVIRMPAMSDIFPGKRQAAPREVSALGDPYLVALLRRLYELDALGAGAALELPPPPPVTPATPQVVRPSVEADDESPSGDE